MMMRNSSSQMDLFIPNTGLELTQGPKSIPVPGEAQAALNDLPGPEQVEDKMPSPDGIQIATPQKAVEVVDATADGLLQAAAGNRSGEDWLTLEEKSQHSQYESLGERVLQEEKKTGDLRLRSKQAILHVTFTEMRVTQLEEQLRKLQARFDGKPMEDFAVRRSQFAIYKSAIKPSVNGDFLLTPNSTEVPTHERPSLEILVTEHEIPIKAQDETVNHFTSALQGTHQRTPESLRIRYAPLILTLERVCRETLSNHNVFGRVEQMQKGKTASTVLLRPWKLFVAYEKEIRNSVPKVQALVESTQQDEANSGAKTVKKGVFGEYEYKYEDLLREFKLLIEFLDVYLKPTFDLRSAIKDGTATEIEYADLWHLFELGDTVITSNDKEQAFRVVNFTGGRDPLVRKSTTSRIKGEPPISVSGFAVDCYSLCFDGTNYASKLEKFSIHKYKGRRPITSLEIFPLRFEKDYEARHSKLVLQGQHYLDLTRSPFSHRMFRGKTLDEPSQDLDAQVIVDIALAINAEPDWRPTKHVSIEDFTQFDERETEMPVICEHMDNEGCCGSDYVFKDLQMRYAGFSSSDRHDIQLLAPRNAEDLKEEDFILLPKWVHAFVLRSRQWVTLKTADLGEVQFENNLDELMFSPIHKKTVVALVETHENARVGTARDTPSVGAALDVVKGKGTGLIILLHGEPGVGKTSTAECVADKTKRPLFPITCGDIGETAMEVEKNLFHNFRLAHKWGCVLLLDEADVFLAKRNKSDLRRNAVTSVFLRSLEYYAGILFLTTNRVGGIDPAFKSRIQLALYYPRIDEQTTVKLYSVFLKRALAEQRKVGVAKFKIKEKEVLKFGARHYRHLKKEGYNTWNGRQIRNAWQTAIALVEYEACHMNEGQLKPVLGKQQFEIVAKGSKEFDRYLKVLLHGGDDEIARRDQWRDDYYENADFIPLSSSKPAPMESSVRAERVPMVTDSESDSSDDSETEDQDEDDNEGTGKIASTAEARADTDASVNMRKNEMTSADLEEFMMFKAFKKAREENLGS